MTICRSPWSVSNHVRHSFIYSSRTISKMFDHMVPTYKQNYTTMKQEHMCKGCTTNANLNMFFYVGHVVNVVCMCVKTLYPLDGVLCCLKLSLTYNVFCLHGILTFVMAPEGNICFTQFLSLTEVLKGDFTYVQIAFHCSSLWSTCTWMATNDRLLSQY